MSPDVSIYVELLVCVWVVPLTYGGDEGIGVESCEGPEVDEGVLGKTELAFAGSAKKSEGEKASGLWC